MAVEAEELILAKLHHPVNLSGHERKPTKFCFCQERRHAFTCIHALGDSTQSLISGYAELRSDGVLKAVLQGGRPLSQGRHVVEPAFLGEGCHLFCLCAVGLDQSRDAEIDVYPLEGIGRFWYHSSLS